MSNFFDWLYQFFVVGLWEQLEAFALWFITRATIAGIEASAWTLGFMQSYILALFTDLSVGTPVEAAFAAMPDDIRATVSLLQVPQAFAVIVAAYPTRIVIRYALKVLA